MTDITTGHFLKALEQPTGKWFDTAAHDYQADFKKIFEIRKAPGRAYVEDTLTSGTGLFRAKPQSSAIGYSRMSQSFTKRYTMMTYADAISISQEMIDDSISLDIIAQKTKALGRAAAHTQDVLAMSVLNEGFNSAYAGGDGKELFAEDHPSKAGAFSNELATPADLSESTLEALDLLIDNLVAEDGLLLDIESVQLVIPKEERFNAHRILQSNKRVATPNNDANAVGDMNLYKKGVVVSKRLTDSDAIYVITNQPDGLIFVDRQPPMMKASEDFETGSAKFKSSFRCDQGWTDPRCAVATAGAD